MAAETFWRGTELVVTATFRNAADALANPTTVKFHTQSPAGVETSYEWTAGAPVSGAPITNPSTGVYELTITPAGTGEWLVVSQGIGGVTITDRQRIQVEATGIAAIDA